jgi:hypothetical protein
MVLRRSIQLILGPHLNIKDNGTMATIKLKGEFFPKGQKERGEVAQNTSIEKYVGISYISKCVFRKA